MSFTSEFKTFGAITQNVRLYATLHVRHTDTRYEGTITLHCKVDIHGHEYVGGRHSALPLWHNRNALMWWYHNVTAVGPERALR